MIFIYYIKIDKIFQYQRHKKINISIRVQMGKFETICDSSSQRNCCKVKYGVINILFYTTKQKMKIQCTMENCYQTVCEIKLNEINEINKWLCNKVHFCNQILQTWTITVKSLQIQGKYYIYIYFKGNRLKKSLFFSIPLVGRKQKIYYFTKISVKQLLIDPILQQGQNLQIGKCIPDLQEISVALKTSKNHRKIDQIQQGQIIDQIIDQQDPQQIIDRLNCLSINQKNRSIFQFGLSDNQISAIKSKHKKQRDQRHEKRRKQRIMKKKRQNNYA